MTDEEKMAEAKKVIALAAMRTKIRKMGLEAIVDGDNVESFVEGIMPNISIGERRFQDTPFIGQRAGPGVAIRKVPGLEGDQVQVLPLNDGKDNFYYAAVKFKGRKLNDVQEKGQWFQTGKNILTG